MIYKILQDITNLKIRTYKEAQSLTYNYTVQNIYSSHKNEVRKCIKLSLKIKNSSANKIVVNQSFPYLNIKMKENFIYLFPKQSIIINQSPIKLAGNYGGIMHFPFIVVKNKDEEQCLMITGGDKKGTFKQINMQKMGNGNFITKFKYYDITLQSDQQYIFPDLYLSVFQNNINILSSSINSYKLISRKWIIYQNINQINNSSNFHKSFIMRVIQLYEIQWHSTHRRVKDLSQLNILKIIKQDEQKIGPIKFIHFRDWSAQNQTLYGKFGNYLKQNVTGSFINKQWLKEQIKQIKAQGKQVGLYFQGYLVSKLLFSQQKIKQLQNYQFLDKQNKPYTIWGHINFIMCPYNKQWQNLLSKSIINSSQYLQSDAVYIDQFGFGTRTSPFKICTNITHQHKINNNYDLQIGQLQLIEKIIKKTLDKIIYIQRTPNDVTINYINGSLSPGARYASQNLYQLTMPILLTRFIYPQHKIYQLITQYTMMQKDILSNNQIVQQNINVIIKAICIAFWNGNGIYVPKNLQYYDKKILQILKICNMFYIEYQQYFNGLFPVPLYIGKYENGIHQILGNKFQYQKGNYILISAKILYVKIKYSNLNEGKFYWNICQQCLQGNVKFLTKIEQKDLHFIINIYIFGLKELLKLIL